jgi:tetratricopeptide (TPR) repeat protein
LLDNNHWHHIRDGTAIIFLNKSCKVITSSFACGLVVLTSPVAQATTINQKSEQISDNLYVQRSYHQREQDYIGYRLWEEAARKAARKQAEYNRQQNELAKLERIRQAQESARASIPELERKGDYLILAREWSTLEEWDKSLDAIEKAIVANPNIASGYMLRASLRKRLNDIPGTLADYDRAITINLNYYGYYQTRGELKKSFDRNGAIQDFRMAMKLVRVETRYNLIKDMMLNELVKELRSLGVTEKP